MENRDENRRNCAPAAALPAAAQVAARPVAAVASIDQPPLSLDVVRNLERVFDAKLDSAQPQPINLMGATRGLYLPGYGLVFTAELDLTLTPTAGGRVAPRNHSRRRGRHSPEETGQLPVLQRLMRDMIAASARQAGTMPDNERIVVAVRLWCQAFEDRTGLPTRSS